MAFCFSEENITRGFWSLLGNKYKTNYDNLDVIVDSYNIAEKLKSITVVIATLKRRKFILRILLIIFEMLTYNLYTKLSIIQSIRGIFIS